MILLILSNPNRSLLTLANKSIRQTSPENNSNCFLKHPNMSNLISLHIKHTLILVTSYVNETPLSRSNCRQERVESSPANPFNRQPSTAHGDLEEFNGLLCLMVSMQPSTVLPVVLSSQFAGM